jgi:hypothetical protein
MTQLPNELRKALLAYDDPVARITEVNHQSGMVCKIPAADIVGSWGEPVSYRYELALYDTGPVLCRALDILDDPRRPFGFGQAPNPREFERGRSKRRTEALYLPPPTARQPRAPGCHRLAVEHLSLTGFWT